MSSQFSSEFGSVQTPPSSGSQWRCRASKEDSHWKNCQSYSILHICSCWQNQHIITIFMPDVHIHHLTANIDSWRRLHSSLTFMCRITWGDRTFPHWHRRTWHFDNIWRRFCSQRPSMPNTNVMTCHTLASEHGCFYLYSVFAASATWQCHSDL